MTHMWAMPSPDTFDCLPIGELVRRYLRDAATSVDPFARNRLWATYTNDLNPDTAAEYHLDAADFLAMLVARGVVADLVIFDPPYSVAQVKECYEGIGLVMGQEDVWRTSAWSKEKAMVDGLLRPGGIFLYFGWNTTGMGKKYGYTTEELLVVNHGAAHNDTLCLVERKPWVTQLSFLEHE